MALVLFVHPGHFSAWWFLYYYYSFFLYRSFLIFINYLFFKKIISIRSSPFLFPLRKAVVFLCRARGARFLDFYFIGSDLKYFVCAALAFHFAAGTNYFVLFFFFFFASFRPVRFAVESRRSAASPRESGRRRRPANRNPQQPKSRSLSQFPFFSYFFSFFSLFFLGGGSFFYFNPFPFIRSRWIEYSHSIFDLIISYWMAINELVVTWTASFETVDVSGCDERKSLVVFDGFQCCRCVCLFCCFFCWISSLDRSYERAEMVRRLSFVFLFLLLSFFWRFFPLPSSRHIGAVIEAPSSGRSIPKTHQNPVKHG